MVDEISGDASPEAGPGPYSFRWSGVIMGFVSAIALSAASFWAVNFFSHRQVDAGPEEKKQPVATAGLADSADGLQDSATETNSLTQRASNDFFSMDYPADWVVPSFEKRGDKENFGLASIWVSSPPESGRENEPPAQSLAVWFSAFGKDLEPSADLSSALIETFISDHGYEVKKYPQVVSIYGEKMRYVFYKVTDLADPTSFSLSAEYSDRAPAEDGSFVADPDLYVSSLEVREIADIERQSFGRVRAASEISVKIKLAVANFRTDAENRAEGGGYEDACNRTASEYLQTIEEVAGLYGCVADRDAWVLWAQLSEGNFFCGDSRGFMGEVAEMPAGAECSSA